MSMQENQRNTNQTRRHWITAGQNKLMPEKSSPAHKSGHGNDPLFFWIPFIMGVVAAVVLISIYGWESKAMITSAILLIVSIGAGWWLSRHHVHIIESLLQTQEESRSKETSFYGQIFPVWSRQITTSRHAGDQAVADLAKIFGEIVVRLKSMLNISNNNTRTEQDHEHDFLTTVATSQTDIQSIFKDLKSALEIVNDSKDMLLAEITMYSANMKEMAVESQQVAFQSQIIALNAEIEAARAGDAGRAFAAVVSEMRQLARQSGDTSKRMTTKVESIDKAMVKFYKEDQLMATKETQQVSRAEVLFKNILENFNQATLSMEKSILTMEIESRQVQDDISRALIALQFQDSVSQIMAHVVNDINALNEFAATENRNLDAAQWIKDMQSKFSVDAEHENLNSHQNTSSQNSSLTFF